MYLSSATLSTRFGGVEQIELDMCVKFQVNLTHGVEVAGLSKFWTLIIAPLGRLESYFLGSICTSFPVIGKKFNVSSLFQLTANWDGIG